MPRTKQQPHTYSVSIPLDENNGNLYYEATFSFDGSKVFDILSYCKDHADGKIFEVPFDIIKEKKLLNDNSNLWQIDNAKDADVYDEEDWYTERYFEEC